MEKEEIGIIQSQSPEEYFDIALWQWQSGPDPDPWAEKDPVKWAWQDYPDDTCRSIEEAFSLKKEIADLGNYEVDLKRMLQVNKKFRNRIRRVRRQQQSRFMMKIAEPLVIKKEQKTMNEAFGTIQHFLDYIMKRTPEAYDLYQKLKIMNIHSLNHEFEELVKEVVVCIEKGAEIRERIIKTRSGSQTKSFLNEAKQIIDFIKKNSATLKDFLQAILKVYTTETFVCYWLNELLRSEDWEEINVLTPYLVCLVYTFKLSEYIMEYVEPQGLKDTFKKFVGREKFYLYRGAALAKKHLELYNPDKVEYFSWNGVTSTSRDENIALRFVQYSLRKAKQLNEPVIGVLFRIKTYFGSKEDGEGMIDVSKNSKFPEEQEIILAPGTVFHLLRKRLIGKDLYEIKLQVVKKFEESEEKIPLLGALQDQAIMKENAIINELPSQQSFKLLEMLKWNKLIRKLVIRNSGIEEYIMEEIEKMRITTKVRKQDIKLVENTIVVRNLGALAHYFSVENLNDIFMSNKIRFKEGDDKDKYEEIEALLLSEESLEKFQQSDQLEELGEKIKNAGQVKNLNLSMKKKRIANSKFLNFLKFIKDLKALQTLRLNILQDDSIPGQCWKLFFQTIGSSTALRQLFLEFTFSDQELSHLKNGLISLKSLQKLSLKFEKCFEISDDALDHLEDGLISLKSLQQLSLDFLGCSKISDQGLVYLKRSLLSLTSLQHLSMNFSWCTKISNMGLDHLKSGIMELKSLHHLSLNFTQCNSISDEGLCYLKEGITLRVSLQHLSLDFSNCNKISDEGINHLKNALIEFTSLQYLSLNLNGCNKITNLGLNHLKNSLMLLKSLQHLSLNFTRCNSISDEGLDHLKSGLISLASLRHLCMRFELCFKISNGGLSNLKDAFRSLQSLQSLSLNFEKCIEISDEGLNYLRSGLLELTSLRSLSLEFKQCHEISGLGLNHLKSSFASLESLECLSLNFFQCKKISDAGPIHLSGGLVLLASLQQLSLNFFGCDQISDEGLDYIKSGLISLPSLKHLSLDFNKSISDKGLENLKSGLISLLSLQHLSLNFAWCSSISDEGLSHLKTSLISLSSLLHLSLNFGWCATISNEGLNHLKDALTSLFSLQHLSLDFKQCDQISDFGLNCLQSGLTSSSSLRSLSLDFQDCYRISDKGLDYLKDGLVKLKSLQSLSLLFFGCRVSNERLSQFYNEFKSISHLSCGI